MCFGSAFIASNSSSSFKVKKIFLTQNVPYDVHLKLQPLKEADNLSEEDQKAEGVDEEDIIKYSQEMRLFNTTDYIGKSKALSFHYNRDMKIELFKVFEEDGQEKFELLGEFILDDIKTQYENEISQREKDAEKAKKKAEKKSNSTEEEETAEAEAVDDGKKKAPPKVKISVEFSRSGIV